MEVVAVSRSFLTLVPVSGIRVVIFDDHAGSRDVLGVRLATRGHACRVVETAEAAVAALTSDHPQVVIYDWRTRSGVYAGLASTMRKIAGASGRELLIIVTSSQDQPHPFDEDVDAYFTKPLDMGELIAFVETRLATS